MCYFGLKPLLQTVRVQRVPMASSQNNISIHAAHCYQQVVGISGLMSYMNSYVISLQLLLLDFGPIMIMQGPGHIFGCAQKVDMDSTPQEFRYKGFSDRCMRLFLRGD